MITTDKHTILYIIGGGLHTEASPFCVSAPAGLFCNVGRRVLCLGQNGGSHLLFLNS